MYGCTHVTGRCLCRAYDWGLAVRARKARNSCLNPLVHDRERHAFAARVAGGSSRDGTHQDACWIKEGTVWRGERVPWR